MSLYNGYCAMWQWHCHCCKTLIFRHISIVSTAYMRMVPQNLLWYRQFWFFSTLFRQCKITRSSVIWRKVVEKFLIAVKDSKKIKIADTTRGTFSFVVLFVVPSSCMVYKVDSQTPSTGTFYFGHRIDEFYVKWARRVLQ